jgi:hypothetical protein
MRNYYPLERLLAVLAFAVLTAGCQQVDQRLPFDLAEGEGATVSIGPNGGTVSVPPSFSLDFPAGSLVGSTSVEVTPRISAPFPDDAGSPVPGSAYDVGPVGTVLGEPATVEIRVAPELLEAGDDVRLAVAVQRADLSVAIFTGTYDLTNGVLRAEIDELGPVAAVVSLGAIPVALGAPPVLGGGTFPLPTAPAPSGPALSSHGGLEFEAACSPEARQCFASGLIRIWADDVVRERMGDELFLLSPTVAVNLEFLAFDPSGFPTQVIGGLSVEGDLRARFNSAVTGYDINDEVTTGPTTAPQPTSVLVTTGIMYFGETTNADLTVNVDEEVEYSITGIGTTEMMTIEVEAELEFENDDDTTTMGVVTAHVRLRVPES